jgi:hypothetical protein
VAEVVRVAGTELGAQIIGAELRHHIQNRLDKHHAAGEDPLGHFSEALRGRARNCQRRVSCPHQQSEPPWPPS